MNSTAQRPRLTVRPELDPGQADKSVVWTYSATGAQEAEIRALADHWDCSKSQAIRRAVRECLERVN